MFTCVKILTQDVQFLRRNLCMLSIFMIIESTAPRFCFQSINCGIAPLALSIKYDLCPSPRDGFASKSQVHKTYLFPWKQSIVSNINQGPPFYCCIR